MAARKEVLHPVKPAALPKGRTGGEMVRAAVHGKTCKRPRATFAAVAARGAEEAFNELQLTLQDCTEVHRVVMLGRAWDLVDLIGKDQAHTLLRQSVHYCVKNEKLGGQVRDRSPDVSAQAP